MRHNLHLSGFAYRMRPIEEGDAEFVLNLRLNTDLNQYLHKTSPHIEDQLEWMNVYFKRADDFYFVVEDFSGLPHGLTALYNFERDAKQAEWGRWVMRKDSRAALDCTVMTYDLAFAQLELERVISRTEIDNTRVISFHTNVGSERFGEVFGNEGEHWIEQHMDAQRWKNCRMRVAQLAKYSADLDRRTYSAANSHCAQ